MSFEDALEYLGGFGKYQRIIFILLSVIGMPHSWQIMGIVFLAGSPNHWCEVQGLDRFNISPEDRMRLSIPTEIRDGEKKYSRCERYDLNFMRFTEADMRASLKKHKLSNFTATLKTRACDSWTYDPSSPFQETVVTEWDLVCERRWLVPTAASVFMAGLMVGVYVFGEIADRYGRRPALLIAIFIFIISSILVSFSPNYIIFVILRFIVGCATMAAYTTAFVLRMEFVGTKWRVITGLAGMLFWSIGFMILAAIAYGLPNWMHLQLATSIPSLLFLSFYWLIPESPRWLFARNRDEEARNIIERMARVNGVQVPKMVDKATQVDEFPEYVQRVTALDLIRTPNMRKKSLILFYDWFVVSFVYYGLSLNTANLGGNAYLTFLLFGAVEIPASVCEFFSLTHIGRRFTLCACMAGSGLALIGTVFVPPDMNWLTMTLSLVGKFCIGIAFSVAYIYSAELFPTKVRNIGVGAGSLHARIGGILAPYIAQLSFTSKHLPAIIFGSTAVLAGIMSWFLPETRGQKLPDTIMEGEEFGKVVKRQDKATWTSDEEVYRIGFAYTNSEMSLNEGYATDDSEWVPNYADKLYGISNLGMRRSSTSIHGNSTTV